MTILHLFDLYLPHTMNWAWQIMRSTPDVEQWVAAPWILRNEYYSADFRFFVRPLQKKAAWLPTNEWQAEWFSSNLIRAERACPLYKNWLFHQLKNNRPDVLHAHFAPVGCHYLDLAQQLGVPLVVSFYGFDYQRLPFQKPVYRERYRQLFEGAAAITCAGEHGREVLMKQGCPAGKITVLPMSFRPEDFPFFEREKMPGQLRLVQVATITEKKGYMDTLAALAVARTNCPNIHLTIAGEKQDQNLVHKMRNYIKAKGLESIVTWLNFLPHEQLADFLTSFDVFIHPSCYTANLDCEGGPVAILEAQSTGLPVISTTHFDIPSEVLHNQTGLLAPERSPAVLAQHMERFYLMGDDEYQPMSQAARTYMEQNFDVKNTAQKLLSLYQSITNHQSPITSHHP